MQFEGGIELQIDWIGRELELDLLHRETDSHLSSSTSVRFYPHDLVSVRVCVCVCVCASVHRCGCDLLR